MVSKVHYPESHGFFIVNYKRIYDQIIERAKFRSLEGYKEKHHIIPKCIGGIDKKENIVELTAREHFLCHKLLVLIYPNKKCLIYALWMMSNGTRNNYLEVSTKDYEYSRNLYSEHRKGFIYTKDSRKKMSESQKSKVGEKNSFYGRKHSEESKRKMREKKLAKKASEDTRKKMSNSRTGLKRTEEQRKNFSIAMSGIPKKKYECPSCKRMIGGITNLYRHIDSCKSKK